MFCITSYVFSSYMYIWIFDEILCYIVRNMCDIYIRCVVYSSISRIMLYNSYTYQSEWICDVKKTQMNEIYNRFFLNQHYSGAYVENWLKMRLVKLEYVTFWFSVIQNRRKKIKKKQMVRIKKLSAVDNFWFYIIINVVSKEKVFFFFFKCVWK